ncbi:hypothetical protein [Microtetraspora sp. NBRC 16547]|uniref:hypothetical protein n=1 Tax=Microtetraspora sp. NBRC 16547 TaxID=3030993 RepID=UPI0024A3BB6D|nr:hypothetical protein [Microtetraspora sp. NBRC 16547]GLX01295.1 hypothetical protein Misp02_53810 [Microtetraspora sp. NBRC 16547]
MRSHLGNRVGILVVGLALLAGGVVTLLAARDRPEDPILDLSFFDENAWARPFGALLPLVIGIVATRWLLLALGWGRWGTRTGSGIAMLGVALKGVEGIGKLYVRLVGDRRMRIGIDLLPEADPAEVIGRLNGEAVSRVRGVVGRGNLPTLVRLHIRRR